MAGLARVATVRASSGGDGPAWPAEAGQPVGAAGGDPVRQAPAAVDRSATGGGSLRWRASGRPTTGRAAGRAGGAGAGGVAAGPVAAVLLAGYGMLGGPAPCTAGGSAGQVGQERRRQLDRLGALAADLRAGLPVPTLDRVDAPAGADGLTGTGADPTGRRPVTAGRSLGRRPRARHRPWRRYRISGVSHGIWSGDGLPSPSPGRSPGRGSGGPNGDPAVDGRRLERLARAAVRLADRTGAPLAELLERVEADARAFDRGMAAAAAQAAGANATALLLAALPLGGVALGYGIGVDPLAVLLHTPVGAACALVAMGLQAGGLLWAERLGATPGGGG